MMLHKNRTSNNVSYHLFLICPCSIHVIVVQGWSDWHQRVAHVPGALTPPAGDIGAISGGLVEAGLADVPSAAALVPLGHTCTFIWIEVRRFQECNYLCCVHLIPIFWEFLNFLLAYLIVKEADQFSNPMKLCW